MSEISHHLKNFNSSCQKNMQLQNTPNYGRFQMPASPPFFDEQSGQMQFRPTEEKNYCIKCGDDKNVSAQEFKKKYVSPVAILGIFIGIIPYFLLRLLLTTTHNISAPFCENCWNKFKDIETHSALFNFGAVMLIILGFLIGGLYDSFLVLAICLCLSIPLFIFGRIYVAKVSPKFKKVDSKQVIINAPKGGAIVFSK